MADLPSRVRPLNDAPLRPGRRWVLYWMIANRRTRTNPALERAVALSRELRTPLLVFEPLRAGYRWASPRIHRFVMDGMEVNREAFAAAGVRYVPWVERAHGQAAGLLESLAARAVAVVTDDWPGFFQPRMLAAVASRLDVRLEAVDGVGLLPLAASERAFTTAASFRRHLQKTVGPHLASPSAREPLAGYDVGLAPAPDLSRWPGAATLGEVTLACSTPVVARRGGERAAQERLEAFLAALPDAADRRHPDARATSRLSPYLHFGHVSGEEVARRVLETSGWSPGDQADRASGSRGWWGLPESAETFLDEVVTWRELGHVFARHRSDYDQLSSIPDWARKTLDDHRDDPREGVDPDRLAAAESPDPLWNAAQRELLATGSIHNHLRMLWGKKILGWAATPELAFDWLTDQNNRHALDGRDPNSASGIAWVFGRHDRAWGPERPIFGKVRYMTSASTGRKLRLADYLARWGRV